MEQSSTATLPELLKKLVNIELYAVFMDTTERWQTEPHRISDILHEHLLWLLNLERQGILFMSGPFNVGGVGGASWAGNGMAILRCGTREDAQKLAQEEPFHREGLRRNTVKQWNLNEGSFNVTIHLFDGTTTLS